MKTLACLPSLLTGAALFTLSLCGCSERTNGPSLGNAEVKMYAISAADVYSVTVTITADDIAAPIVVPLTKVGDQWVVSLAGIPAGTNRTFTLSALDASGTEIYSGVATGVTIAADQTASVSIGGQETNPPPPTGNAAPVIDALVASSISVVPGTTVNLSVNAHDPDAGDTLSYLWTSSNGGGFDSTTTSATNWTAPETNGTYRITVQVQDNRGAQTTMPADVTVRAESDAGTTATISVSLNKWPVVSEVTSTNGRIDVSGTTTLDCTAADDDGDPLTYAWSTDSGCAGTFSALDVKNPTFTLGDTLPVSGACQFSVTVSDGRGGTGTGSLTITASAPPPVNVAPQIASFSQSAESAVAGQTVTLWVLASDPEGTAVTFAWSAAVGTFGTPVDLSAGSEQVVWTAPLNFVAEVQIQATVTDAGNASTVKSFTIAKMQPPSGGDGWTVDPSYYGAGDGCDCGSGSWDPDCAVPGQVLHGCNNGQTCVQSGQAGVCQTVMTPSMPDPAPPSTPPAGWTCSPSYYDANDGCDCKCGAFDPDCGKPNQRVFDCNVGQYCGSSGTCESLTSH